MIGVSYYFKPTSNFSEVSEFLYQYPFAHLETLLLVQTNLVEHWQVSDKRLPLLHEMAPNSKFRETLLEEKDHVLYLPLHTKIFQTIEIYLTSGCGEQIPFLDRIVNMVLHFQKLLPRRELRTPVPKTHIIFRKTSGSLKIVA